MPETDHDIELKDSSQQQPNIQMWTSRITECPPQGRVDTDTIRNELFFY